MSDYWSDWSATTPTSVLSCLKYSIYLLFTSLDPKSEHWIAWRNTVEKKIQELKTYLNVFEKRCEEKKITCHTVLHNGQPGEAICEIAEERDVTLIVLGSRGLNKIRRTFLGSVSDYVIHHCKKPVLVVPQPK